MIFSRCFSLVLRLKFFLRKPHLTYVSQVARQTESAFIAEQHFSHISQLQRCIPSVKLNFMKLDYTNNYLKLCYYLYTCWLEQNRINSVLCFIFTLTFCSLQQNSLSKVQFPIASGVRTSIGRIYEVYYLIQVWQFFHLYQTYIINDRLSNSFIT